MNNNLLSSRLIAVGGGGGGGSQALGGSGGGITGGAAIQLIFVFHAFFPSFFACQLSSLPFSTYSLYISWSMTQTSQATAVHTKVSVKTTVEVWVPLNHTQVQAGSSTSPSEATLTAQAVSWVQVVRPLPRL